MRSKKSSSTKARVVCLAAVFPATLLAGCADYVKRQDTITRAAGEAHSWNRVVHTTDPWPPYVMNTHIPGDGQRTEAAIRRYSTGNVEGQQGGAAPLSPAPTSPSP